MSVRPALVGRMNWCRHEVQDDEVVVDAYPLDPTDEGSTGHSQARFLEDLTFDRLPDQFTGFNPSSRHRPQTDTRWLPSLDQEQVSIDDNNGADGQDWRFRSCAGGQPVVFVSSAGVRERWTTS